VQSTKIGSRRSKNITFMNNFKLHELNNYIKI
jgi:hypothetical protein